MAYMLIATHILNEFTNLISGETRQLVCLQSLSGVPDYFGRNKISSGGDLSHYSSASLY